MLYLEPSLEFFSVSMFRFSFKYYASFWTAFYTNVAFHVSLVTKWQMFLKIIMFQITY